MSTADASIALNKSLAANTPANNAAKAQIRTQALLTALAASGVKNLGTLGDALAQAVKDKVLSEDMVRTIAVTLAPGDTASQARITQGSTYGALATTPINQTLITASTNTAPTVSALVNLSSVTLPSSLAAALTGRPTPFDPCAGVIAAYCGG